MIIYVDMFLLENFIMNLSIIFSEALLLNAFNDIGRKVIGAAIGSILAFIYFYTRIPNVFSIFISILIVIVSFGMANIKELFKRIILFYFISFVFGGISFALINQVFNNIEMLVLKSSSLVLIFISAIIGFMCLKYILLVKRKQVLKDIVIYFRGLKVEVRILLDTGNLLREPYTNKPVIIVEKDSINEIISGKKIKTFLIPYKSLGNSLGFLYGIKPDFVLVKESNLKIKNVVIGICNEKLSSDGMYFGIFGLETLDGGV